MFAAVFVWIKCLPWWGQAIAWPLYAMTWVISQVIGWALGELGNRAKVRGKQILGPLLWPTIGLVVFGVIWARASTNDERAQLLALLIIIGGLAFHLRGRMKKKKTP